MRSVWIGNEWELHLPCKKEIPVENASGDEMGGIDLSSSNYFATPRKTSSCRQNVGDRGAPVDVSSNCGTLNVVGDAYRLLLLEHRTGIHANTSGLDPGRFTP